MGFTCFHGKLVTIGDKLIQFLLPGLHAEHVAVVKPPLVLYKLASFCNGEAGTLALIALAHQRLWHELKAHCLSPSDVSSLIEAASSPLVLRTTAMHLSMGPCWASCNLMASLYRSASVTVRCGRHTWILMGILSPNELPLGPRKVRKIS